MAAAYPSGVKTFTTKTNKVDLVDADHINDLQLEVVAIQEELGTDVAGSAATLKIRLAVNTAADGGIVSGGADPGGSPKTATLFYRTDISILRVYTGAAWQDAGLPSDGSITQAKLYAVTAGTYNEVSAVVESTSNSPTTYVKVDEFKVAHAGIYRVTFNLKSVSGRQAYGRIYVDGVAVGTERSTASLTYETQATEDITVDAGVLIQLYIHTNINTDGTVYSNLFKLGTVEAMILPVIGLD